MTLMRAYSPQEQKPLGGYAAITAVFNGAALAYVMARRRSARALPSDIPPTDIVLLALATYKLSRLLSKDRVTSFLRAPFTRYQGEAGPGEVSEEPRGSGLQRSIGELLVCPYCMGQWVGAGFLATYLARPRAARVAASLFAIVAGADFLQQAWAGVNKAV
jgi:hypothetical protein